MARSRTGSSGARRRTVAALAVMAAGTAVVCIGGAGAGMLTIGGGATMGGAVGSGPGSVGMRAQSSAWSSASGMPNWDDEDDGDIEERSQNYQRLRRELLDAERRAGTRRLVRRADALPLPAGALQRLDGGPNVVPELLQLVAGLLELPARSRSR